MREGLFVGEVIRDEAGRTCDFVFIEMNEAFEEQTGVVAAMAIGRRATEVIPNLRSDTIAIYASVVNTGEPAVFERTFPERDNRVFEARADRIGADRFSLLLLDITARKRVEETANASAAKFRTFAQTLPNHVWTAPANGLLDWFNDRVYEFSGARDGELDGNGWGQIVHPDDLPGVAEGWAAALASGETYEVQFRLRRADGAYRWHIARAVPIRDETGTLTRWIGTNTDIEDQKNAAAELSALNADLESRVAARTEELLRREEQLHQAQKMEAVGQLTGGIAHDFNNMLAVIKSSLVLARKRTADGKGNIEPLLTAGLEGVERAAALVKRLLAFSRQQPLAPEIHDANELILGMVELLHRTLGTGFRVETALAADLWPVNIDVSQFENTILNLALNARDAMPDGGILKIHTCNKALDRTFVAGDTGVEPGDFVCLSVIDQGEGMTPEVIARAFEPFFTTKPLGKGTGLGLSQIFGFVKQSGGFVRITSEKGHGAMIAIYLPADRAEALSA
jgi:PAS domain S-box-containing protein